METEKNRTTRKSTQVNMQMKSKISAKSTIFKLTLYIFPADLKVLLMIKTERLNVLKKQYTKKTEH